MNSPKEQIFHLWMRKYLKEGYFWGFKIVVYEMYSVYAQKTLLIVGCFVNPLKEDIFHLWMRKYLKEGYFCGLLFMKYIEGIYIKMKSAEYHLPLITTSLLKHDPISTSSRFKIIGNYFRICILNNIRIRIRNYGFIWRVTTYNLIK